MTYPRNHKAELARLRAITAFAKLVAIYPDARILKAFHPGEGQRCDDSLSATEKGPATT